MPQQVVKIQCQDSIDTQDRSSYTPAVKKQCLINSINSIQERGWTPSGIPTPATLKQISLWDFLTEEARAKIGTLVG
jgi:hypothetical protein